jgi:uncharacterized RDD family membrane protein YckC
VIPYGVRFFRSTPGPAPCPVCDEELDPPPGSGPVCHSCDATLLPVRTGGSWRRLAGFAVDAALVAMTAAPIAWGLSAIAPGAEPWPAVGLNGLLLVLAGDLGTWALRLVPIALVAAAYFVLFSTLGGQTVGQRLLKLRVVDQNGRVPSLGRASVRVASAGLGLAPLGLGALWMFFDPNRRAVHDLIARTYVVTT